MDEQQVAVKDRTYRYAIVLSALSSAFGAKNADGIMLIRSRLKYFQKRGFGPPARGSGREIEYTFSDIMDWAIGLTLAKVGLPARFIIKNLGHGAYKKKIEKHTHWNCCYIYFFPSLVFEALPEDADPLTWGTIAREIELNAFFERMQEDRINGTPFDYSLANISHLISSIEKELAALTS